MLASTKSARRRQNGGACPSARLAVRQDRLHGNRAPVAPGTPHPLPLIRYMRGTTEQQAAEPAVLREGSSSSGSGAALRTTTQVLAVVATCAVMQGASLAFALAFSTRFYGGMVMKTLMVRAATLFIPGCNPIHPWLQPYSSRAAALMRHGHEDPDGVPRPRRAFA